MAYSNLKDGLAFILCAENGATREINLISFNDNFNDTW
jgi:hypothetical protein